MPKEYIEREAAKARLRIWITDCVLDGNNDEADCFRDCIDLLDSIPAADVMEVVRRQECLCYTPVDDNIGKCVFLTGKHQYVVPDGYCYLEELKEGAGND